LDTTYISHFEGAYVMEKSTFTLEVIMDTRNDSWATQPHAEKRIDPHEELASPPSISSCVYAALVIAGLLAYASYIWIAARHGRQDDIQIVALAWAPLVVTLLHYGPCALRSMALLLRQGAIGCLKIAKWIDRSTPK